MEALDSLREMRPAAIVLDMSMPEVNGLEFLECYEHLTGSPAEDALGWSQAQIGSYYVRRGLALDGIDEGRPNDDGQMAG